MASEKFVQLHIFVYVMARKITFWWDSDEVHIVLEQHAEWEFDSTI